MLINIPNIPYHMSRQREAYYHCHLDCDFVCSGCCALLSPLLVQGPALGQQQRCHDYYKCTKLLIVQSLFEPPFVRIFELI